MQVAAHRPTCDCARAAAAVHSAPPPPAEAKMNESVVPHMTQEQLGLWEAANGMSNEEKAGLANAAITAVNVEVETKVSETGRAWPSHKEMRCMCYRQAAQMLCDKKVRVPLLQDYGLVRQQRLGVDIVQGSGHLFGSLEEHVSCERRPGAVHRVDALPLTVEDAAQNCLDGRGHGGQRARHEAHMPACYAPVLHDAAIPVDARHDGAGRVSSTATGMITFGNMGAASDVNVLPSLLVR